MREDVGDGDHTTLAAILPDMQSRARLLVKEDGVLAGVGLAAEIFKSVDAHLVLDESISDGQAVKKGDIAFHVHGSARSILTAERLVLNCLQRMSGIATKTHRYTQIVQDTGATIIDTRKTSPNFRLLEKWAVLLGGGSNHRLGLFDMIMLKDNHIDFAGGIEVALLRVKDYLDRHGLDLPVEIETRNLSEVEQALRVGGIAVIMLDNMSCDTMIEAVKMVNGQCKTEASGGITEVNLREVAETGVDYISIGELTHSVDAMDLSLKAY